MNRLGSFTFEGVEYPTLASARALQNYCDRYNMKLEKVFETFTGDNVESTLFLLSELLKAGYVWTLREGGEAKQPPSFDMLMDFLSLTDMAVATFSVIDTMAKSLKATVNAKNAEATPHTKKQAQK